MVERYPITDERNPEHPVSRKKRCARCEEEGAIRIPRTDFTSSSMYNFVNEDGSCGFRQVQFLKGVPISDEDWFRVSKPERHHLAYYGEIDIK